MAPRLHTHAVKMHSWKEKSTTKSLPNSCQHEAWRSVSKIYNSKTSTLGINPYCRGEVGLMSMMLPLELLKISLADRFPRQSE